MPGRASGDFRALNHYTLDLEVRKTDCPALTAKEHAWFERNRLAHYKGQLRQAIDWSTAAKRYAAGCNLEEKQLEAKREGVRQATENVESELAAAEKACRAPWETENKIYLEAPTVESGRRVSLAARTMNECMGPVMEKRARIANGDGV